MNYIDIVCIVPLLWAGYRGFSKGLIIEVASLVALGLGIWGGLHFSDLIADFVQQNINEEYEPVISFTLLFVGIVIGVFLLGKALEKVIDLAQLKLINKILGGVFGIVKVLLIVGVLVSIVDRYNQRLGFISPKTKNESLLYTPIIEATNMLIPAIDNSDTLGALG